MFESRKILRNLFRKVHLFLPIYEGQQKCFVQPSMYKPDQIRMPAVSIMLANVVSSTEGNVILSWLRLSRSGRTQGEESESAM